MKISSIINELLKDLESSGDRYGRSFHIETDQERTERKMIHQGKPMTLKRFKEWVKEQENENKLDA